jgi:feruloyl esterase
MFTQIFPVSLAKHLFQIACQSLLLATVATSSLYGQSGCERLAGLKLDGARVVSAVLVPDADLPATPPPENFPGAHVPEHCEVKALATPTSDSVINFLLWLPPASKWNGKYLQKGSGGWGGVISRKALITPLKRGYATAATDDGHTGGPGGRFVVGHPEKLIDFGYRAIHETSRQSRAIIAAFYGSTIRQAYFVGCSDGGREALMQAERFPEDFNGIVAGAPANNWTHHFAGFVWNERAIFQDGKNVLPASKLAILQEAALKACDALDGVQDGLIEDPRKCHFDLSVLLCKSEERPDCLTSAEVEAAKKIYAGPKDPVTGEQIYPGYEPGLEGDPSTWKAWILGHVQADFGNSNFADAVYEDSKWDWRNSNLHQDLQRADQKVAPYVNSYNPDLRTFRDHGGKLIQYHGWADAAVAPRDSIAFYELVREFMGRYPDPRAHTKSSSIDDFYRLFMAPGMSHCSGGAGPDAFGNQDLPPASVPQDADHDIVLALDRWVVDGVAPDRIVATRASRIAAASTELMTRPLCVYPKIAHYKGSGSTNDAANFVCVADTGADSRN